MSQKTFIEKTAQIGNVTIVRDWSMGRYGVSVVSVNVDDSINWQVDPYEFSDEETAESVFNLLIAVVVEMTPEIQEATITLIPDEEQ